MSSSFDFDRRFTAWLDDQAPMGEPEGLTDAVLDRTRHTRRLPGWATRERWLPMQTTYRFGAIPRSAIILVILGLLLAVVGAVALGQQSPVPSGRIVFASNRADVDTDPAGEKDELYLMNPDGSGITRLTNDPPRDMFPALSLDGTTIAFTSDRTGMQEIHLMSSDGSGDIRQLTSGKNANNPSWSGDGQMITFAAYTTGDVWVMKADGSGQTRLTSGRFPAFSPDGRMIAFHNDDEREIYVMSADGTGARPLTSGLKYAERPAWSPDGQWIVYPGTPEGSDNVDLYLMRADGSGTPIRLTTDPEVDGYPAFSPDGQWIVFERDAGNGNDGQIHIMRADGTGETQITDVTANYLGITWGIAVPTPASQPPSS